MTRTAEPKPEHAVYIELKARAEQQMEIAVCNGCTGCSLRCADGVQATREEWDAIQTYISSTTSEQRDYIRRIEKQAKSVDLGDGVSVTMCQYWDMESQRCAVYPARPLICRLLGHVEWMPCPIEKVPRMISTPDALALMREYARFERKTFAEWESRS